MLLNNTYLEARDEAVGVSVGERIQVLLQSLGLQHLLVKAGRQLLMMTSFGRCV